MTASIRPYCLPKWWYRVGASTPARSQTARVDTVGSPDSCMSSAAASRRRSLVSPRFSPRGMLLLASRTDLQSADRLAVYSEAILQVDGSARKVSLQVNMRDVRSFTRGLQTGQLSGVLVCRRDIFSPLTNRLRATPGPAFVKDDGVVGE